MNPTDVTHRILNSENWRFSCPTPENLWARTGALKTNNEHSPFTCPTRFRKPKGLLWVHKKHYSLFGFSAWSKAIFVFAVHTQVFFLVEIRFPCLKTHTKNKKYFNSIGKGTRKGGNRCDLTYARILETFNSTFSEQDACRRAQFFLLLRLSSKVVCESGPDLSYRSNFLPDTYWTTCVPKGARN